MWIEDESQPRVDGIDGVIQSTQCYSNLSMLLEVETESLSVIFIAPAVRKTTGLFEFSEESQLPITQ